MIETKLKQLEYDRVMGNLIPLDEAQEEVCGVVQKIKTKLEGMPSRVALEVSGIDDPREVDRLIGSIVYECLTELSISFMEETDGAVESIG